MTAPVVFLVDDDAASRDAIGLLLETAGLAVESYASAESFLDGFRDDRLGCLVLDVRMNGMSGPELQSVLVHLGSNLPIIFLSAYGDIPMTVRAMKAGAVDFLTKPVDSNQLLERVQAAVQQHRRVLGDIERRASNRRRLEELTPREREIMALVLKGQSNKLIAQELDISYRTVEIHRSHILQKTGTSSVLELSKLASSCGFGMDFDEESAAGTGSDRGDEP